MKKYNKLVRDRIPEIIEADGSSYKFHIAKDKEYRLKLTEKLREEVEEFLEKPCAEEIGDVLEVIEAIIKLHNIEIDDIKQQKLTKRKNHGGFTKKIILESTEKYRDD